MALDASTSTGLEGVEREAFITLFENLNAEIDSVETYWDAKDEELAELRQTRLVPTYLERIERDNFHLGHKPSLIEAPLNEYPNVAVMAAESSPASDQPDQYDILTNLLIVEVMVKSPTVIPAGSQGQTLTDQERADLHVAEEVVNRRCKRTTDAVLTVLRRDLTFGGTIPPLKGPPTSVVSDVFIRREKPGQGPIWFWQGSRIEWEIERPMEIF